MRLRRTIAPVFLCLCSAWANGQAGAPAVIGDALNSLRQAPYQPNPLQPTGFPEPGAKILPEPAAKQPKSPTPGPDDEKRFHVLHAGILQREGDISRLTGGVEFTYRGYHALADNASWDNVTHIANLNGHVRIFSGETVVHGGQVIVDFDQKTYRAFDSESQISPKLVGGQIRGLLYVNGRESFGEQEESRTYDGDLTTCNLEHPHYDIEGEDVVLRPGVRAIFRRAKVRIFGRTVLKLPFLSIPLDDRSYQNMPVVGESPDEGYYIKTHWAIPLQGRNELQTRLDYMSRLGLGYGATYLYQQRGLSGYLKVYSITGPGNMLQISDQHKQQFKWGTLTASFDYENNNYLTSPGTVLFQGRLMLEIPQKGGSERFSYSRTSQSAQGYSSVTQDISYSDQQTIGKKIQTSVTVDYNETSNQSQGGSASQQQVDVTLKASDDTPKGQAAIQYQRAIPIGSTPNFYGGNDQTPVVTFDSDAQRLMGKKFADFLPFKTEVSIGNFQDFTGSHISRESIDFSFQKPDRSKSPFHADFTGEFKQGFYSDDTAQYILNFGTVFSYKLGKDTSANLRYNYLRPYGYSPLPQDSTGQTNLTTFDVSYRPLNGLLVGGQTGYDILQLQQHTGSPWQQVALRSEYSPSKWFLVRSLVNYDTLDEVWSSLRFDLAYHPGATSLTIGSQYDGIRKVWSIVNLALVNLKISRTMLSVNFSYNGYTNQFDSEQLNAIYDLHCAEAVLTYSDFNTGFRPGRTIEFFIRIKAFPFNSAFGIGQRGQPLGSGTGNGY